MEAPLFSQIPTAVLQRVQDADHNKRRRLIETARIRDEYNFADDSVQENISSEVSSSLSRNKPKKAKAQTEFEFAKPAVPVPKLVRWEKPATAEVSVQTDPEPEPEEEPGPVMIEQATQTVETGESYEQYKNRLASESLSVGYKPVYSIPAINGNGPPLKIGLTLPKGKKRKVFYPDEEKEE